MIYYILDSHVKIIQKEIDLTGVVYRHIFSPLI